MPAWAQTPSAPSAAEVRPRLHGYLLDDGEFTVIDAPDAILGTGALGINNRGQMVGQYGAADGRIHGFLLEDGVFTTIDAPGAINTNASDINERGEIVVFYLEANEGQ
jgi:probable HAF family extracellular repeat protein